MYTLSTWLNYLDQLIIMSHYTCICIVEPRTSHFVPCREVVFSSEVENVSQTGNICINFWGYWKFL